MGLMQFSQRAAGGNASGATSRGPTGIPYAIAGADWRAPHGSVDRPTARRTFVAGPQRVLAAFKGADSGLAGFERSPGSNGASGGLPQFHCEDSTLPGTATIPADGEPKSVVFPNPPRGGGAGGPGRPGVSTKEIWSSSARLGMTSPTPTGILKGSFLAVLQELIRHARGHLHSSYRTALDPDWYEVKLSRWFFFLWGRETVTRRATD